MAHKVAIIGVPMDLGANRRGVDMGPSAIRAADLNRRVLALGFEVKDYGDMDVPIPESLVVQHPKKKFVHEIALSCDKLKGIVKEAKKEGRTPIVLGGDHSIAVGSVSGTADFFNEMGKRIGLIWFDAHGDMNTPETSPTGNVHGMPLSHILGKGADELLKVALDGHALEHKNAVLVGVRDLDTKERQIIKESGIKVFTMKEIDIYGMSKVMQESIAIASDGTAGFHLSFDIDVVDPQVAPGVGTPKKGGMNYRESHLSMELVADSGKMTSMDVVEVNPILDTGNQTAELAVELILSALGKRIY